MALTNGPASAGDPAGPAEDALGAYGEGDQHPQDEARQLLIQPEEQAQLHSQRAQEGGDGGGDEGDLQGVGLSAADEGAHAHKEAQDGEEQDAQDGVEGGKSSSGTGGQEVPAAHGEGGAVQGLGQLIRRVDGEEGAACALRDVGEKS